MKLLEVEALSIIFPTGPVVEGLTFSLARGEVLAIVGESGSGKSLTALALVDLLPASARARFAAFRWDGRSVSPEGRAELRGAGIGFVFQEPLAALNPLLTIGAQVEEALREPEPARALEVLASVGLTATQARAYPHALSGGQRQRALMAVALAADPALLVADEPTTALDATLALQLLALLRERVLRDRRALLFISHDLAAVRALADRVLVLYAGRVAEVGPTAALLEAPRHPYTAALRDADPARARPGEPLPNIPGHLPGPTERGPGCLFAPRCARRTEACAEPPPLLALAPDHRVACWHPLEGRP